MRRGKKGTPFPTGLFKSREFLQKVEKALSDGMIDRGMSPSADFQVVRVRDVRTRNGKSLTKVKVMVGDKIGSCYIAKRKVAKGLRAAHA